MRQPEKNICLNLREYTRVYILVCTIHVTLKLAADTASIPYVVPVDIAIALAIYI